MTTLVFGQTLEMAERFVGKLACGGVVISTESDIPRGCDLVVHLVGAWEDNKAWSSILSELRRQANLHVVKVFVASEVV
jgi:hypothetical protein